MIHQHPRITLRIAMQTQHPRHVYGFARESLRPPFAFVHFFDSKGHSLASSVLLHCAALVALLGSCACALFNAVLGARLRWDILIVLPRTQMHS